jgi:hypothetical protein
MTRCDISRYLGALLAAVIVLPDSSLAQSARIGISVNTPAQSSCEVTLIPGVHSLTIRLDGTVSPVKTARFKVVSSCPVAFFGTPANQEYDLTFPTCLNAGDEIQNFGILVSGSTQVCTISVVPVSGSTNIELTDCNGNAMIGAWSHNQPYCGTGLLAPYLPVPANGSVDVPTNQLLSYTGPANLVVLDTDPLLDPDSAEQILCTSHIYPPGEPPCTLPVDPGPLAPHTTYYWMALNVCFGCEHGEYGASELFSFTTGDGPTATEPATWGRVKAMYRN